tara:strand:+ start:2966 stop:4048 length:1083 start_codon:yes stop_codon:yes gene_type:complete
MEHGGSYERDAAIGGYDRKELRGLSKQARSGTLTQRERARYKYLKDERGGRRKRGLLAGLGGVGTTLAALAAAGKLGGGGGEGGAGLMDAIKSRIDDKRKSRADELGEKGEGSMEGVSSQEAQEMKQEINKLGLMESGPGIGEAPVSSNMQIPEGLPFQERSEGGPPVRPPVSDVIAPSVPGPEGRSDTPGSHVEETPSSDIQALLEMARDDASRVSSENPLPTGITSTQRNTAPEVDLGGMLTQEELDAENDLPGRIGEEPTRGSDRPNVSQLFDALNRSKASEINVDPEGLASDQSPGAAQTLLNAYNEKRRELGLEPAIQLTKEMIEETEGAMDPRDRVTPQLMTRRPPRQIFNRYR